MSVLNFLASSHSKKRERKSSSSQLLYTTTAKINKTNTKGETALHLAAKKGDLALIKSLIASGACVNQKDYAGVVFLIYHFTVLSCGMSQKWPDIFLLIVFFLSLPPI